MSVTTPGPGGVSAAGADSGANAAGTDGAANAAGTDGGDWTGWRNSEVKTASA